MTMDLLKTMRQELISRRRLYQEQDHFKQQDPFFYD
jgi:hypothetical protein